MTALEASRVVAVLPGGGRSVDLGGGFGVDSELGGDDTGGQLAVVEHPFAVGTWVPPHVHSREDEEVVLGPGGPSEEQTAGLAARYGLTFHEPDWLADVLRRFDLAPPA